MNLYISNLGVQTTDESLKALFTSCGEVSSAKVIKDHFTGQSRGFAFVEMPNDAEANEAITKMNNAVLDEQNISVQEARPKTEHKGSYATKDKSKRW